MPTTRAQEASNTTSLPGGGASIAAASLRAPYKDEILPIDVSTTTKVYNVPVGAADQPDWRGRIINVYAEVDVYIQFSFGADAAIDENAKAPELLASGRYTLSKVVAGTACWLLPRGQWIPVAVDPLALSFAVKAKVAGILRTHVAET